jgi:hypothetical protein
MLNSKSLFDKNQDAGTQHETIAILRASHKRHLNNNWLPGWSADFEPSNENEIHSCKDGELS